MKPPEIREKMEQINQFIIDCDLKVRRGTMVDVRGLDKEIATICTRATALSPTHARDLQPLMAEMIGNLEQLGLSLKNYKDSLKKK
jgi:hypothetical protein